MAESNSDPLGIASKALNSASTTADLAKATGAVQAAAARRVSEAVEQAAQQLNDGIERLAKQINEFTDKADKGTNRLAKWTMWLAITTFLLFLAAFLDAYVTWSVGP